MSLRGEVLIGAAILHVRGAGARILLLAGLWTPIGGCLWQSLRYGTPSLILGIRGAATCWEPSVPSWPCSDLAAGRSMRVFLVGTAWTFESERTKSSTSFESFPPLERGHFFCSDLVSAVTPSGVVPRRDVLHNADMNKGSKSVQRSWIGEATHG